MLLRHADAALYRAKARGRNRFELFDHGLAVQAATRVRLDADLRRADDRNELSLVYQPQINFRTGKVLGFEALMRWHHPQLGPVSPSTVHPDRRRDRPDLDAGRLGPGAGVPRPGRLGPQWHGSVAHRGQRVAAPAAARRSGGPGRAGARPKPGLPPTRLELEFTETALLLEDERDRRDHSPPARSRRRLGAGRFRHRLLVAQPPAPVSDPAAEDGPLVRARHRRQPRRCRRGAGDHRARPRAAAGGRRRGRGNGGAAGAPRQLRLRGGARLLSRPSGAGARTWPALLKIAA